MTDNQRDMKHLVMLAILLSLAVTASAQDSGVRLDCDAKAGTVVIRYTLNVSDEDPPWAEDRKP